MISVYCLPASVHLQGDKLDRRISILRKLHSQVYGKRQMPTRTSSILRKTTQKDIVLGAKRGASFRREERYVRPTAAYGAKAGLFG
jgi:hypothetical protein